MVTAQVANQAMPKPQAVANLYEVACRKLQQFLESSPDRVQITSVGVREN